MVKAEDMAEAMSMPVCRLQNAIRKKGDYYA